MRSAKSSFDLFSQGSRTICTNFSEEIRFTEDSKLSIGSLEHSEIIMIKPCLLEDALKHGTARGHARKSDENPKQTQRAHRISLYHALNNFWYLCSVHKTEIEGINRASTTFINK